MGNRDELERRVAALEALVTLLLNYGHFASVDASVEYAAGLGHVLAQRAARDDLKSTLSWLVEKSRYPEAQERMRQDINYTRRGVRELEDVLGRYASLNTLGIDARKVPLQRFLPIRIWLDTDDGRLAARVCEAVDKVADTLSFESR